MHHGQEIYSFFYKYGINGFFGIIFSTILLCIIIYKTLVLSKKYNLNSYNELLDKIIKNKIIKNIIKIIINIFLIASFYIMVAGFSAYFFQQFGINKIISSIILLILCYFTFNKNVDIIIKISTILIPVIIIIFFVFGIKNINGVIKFNLNNENNFLWLFNSIIYTSYNSITLIGLTGEMNRYLKNKKECLCVAILSSLIIFSLALIIFCLLINVNDNVEIPILNIAENYGGLYKYLYNVVILIAIFTTAVSEGYSFLKNISKGDSKKYSKLNLLMCISSIPVSLIGFAKLVNIVYPIFGVIGLIQIFNIIIKK